MGDGVKSFSVLLPRPFHVLGSPDTVVEEEGKRRKGSISLVGKERKVREQTSYLKIQHECTPNRKSKLVWKDSVWNRYLLGGLETLFSVLGFTKFQFLNCKQDTRSIREGRDTHHLWTSLTLIPGYYRRLGTIQDPKLVRSRYETPVDLSPFKRPDHKQGDRNRILLYSSHSNWTVTIFLTSECTYLYLGKPRFGKSCLAKFDV